ncbi:hypothetical protein [Acetobacter persici]|uniref:Uncharacterized protein n=1 Tax=Acetobacter persici TaxID=1076596 RepID=A0A1U9LJ71_9PROT|nr:hypothetical protein [Acetobacter persici]AQT06409.1 hypothetical protein A0U91_15455 [Acetobacter persici]
MAEGIQSSFVNSAVTVNGQASPNWGRFGVAATQGFTSGLASTSSMNHQAFTATNEALSAAVNARNTQSPANSQRISGLMRRVARQNAVHAQNERVTKLPPLRTTFAREAQKMRRWGKNLAAAAVLNAQLTASAATRKMSSVGKFFSAKARDIKTGATEFLHAQSVRRTIKLGTCVAACAALGAFAPHMMTAMPNAAEVGQSLAHHGQHAVHAVGDIHHHAHNAVKAAARTGHHLAHSGLRSVMHGGHQHIETASHIVKSAASMNPDLSADALNMQQLQILHDPAKTITQHAQTLGNSAPQAVRHAVHTMAAQAPAATGGITPSNPLAAEVAKNMQKGPAAALHVPLGQQIAHVAKSTFVDQPSAFLKGMAQGISDMGKQMSAQPHSTMLADAGKYTHDYSANTPR